MGRLQPFRPPGLEGDGAYASNRQGSFGSARSTSLQLPLHCCLRMLLEAVRARMDWRLHLHQLKRQTHIWHAEWPYYVPQLILCSQSAVLTGQEIDLLF